MRHLLGERREELAHLTEPVLVLANNLSPSETTRLDRKFVLGFATEVGGHTSHTAILAGAMEIPAVVGIGNFLSDVSGSEMIIIDGGHGVVIIDPDDDTLVRYRDSEERSRSRSKRLSSLSKLPCETQDGVAISMLETSNFRRKLSRVKKKVRESACTGPNFCTESNEPTEEDHYQAYCQVLKAFRSTRRHPNFGSGIGQDAGALRAYPDSANPAQRAQHSAQSQHLQLSRRNFEPPCGRRMRRPADHVSLISTLLEFRQAKMVLSDVIEDLEEQGIRFAVMSGRNDGRSSSARSWPKNLLRKLASSRLGPTT